MTWHQVKDVREFLSRTEPKRVRDHHELKGRIAHWPYCVHCGLVALKNDVTKRELRKSCVS